MLEIFIVFLIVKGIMKLCKKVRNNVNDSYAKCNNKAPNGLTWVDSFGKMRLTSNDHLCLYKTLSNGSKVLQDIENGNIIKNYTQDQQTDYFQESLKNAKEQGKTICCVDFNTHEHDGRNSIVGMRYMDMRTKKKYVIRNFDSVPFYLDMETGKICDVVNEKLVRGRNVQDIRNRWHKLQNKNEPKWQLFFNSFWHRMDDIAYCGKDWNK